MRKLLACWIVLVALEAVCGAAETTITNYIDGYVCVSSTFTNAGDTGLSVSNAYIAIPVDSLAAITETQAGADSSGDIRVLLYAITEHVYNGLEAEGTNAPANLTVGKGLSIQANGTNTDAVVRHTVTTILRIGTTSIPAE